MKSAIQVHQCNRQLHWTRKRSLNSSQQVRTGTRQQEYQPRHLKRLPEYLLNPIKHSATQSNGMEDTIDLSTRILVLEND